MRETTMDPTTVSKEIKESAARAPRLEVDEGHRVGSDCASEVHSGSTQATPPSRS